MRGIDTFSDKGYHTDWVMETAVLRRVLTRKEGTNLIFYNNLPPPPPNESVAENTGGVSENVPCSKARRTLSFINYTSRNYRRLPVSAKGQAK
jgi:hypothetical protein